MKKNMILCESPLQYNNALSYIAHIEEDCDLIIIIRKNGDIDNDSQLDSSKNIEQTKNVNVYSRTVRKNNKLALFFFSVSILLRFVILNRRYNNIVVGDVRSKWMNVVLWLTSPRNVIFVDDGLATVANIELMENFKNKGTTSLYTIFDIRSDKINVIKKSLKNTEAGDGTKIAFFIGGPYVEKNIITTDAYLSILKLFINKFSSEYELYYALHRSENELSTSELYNMGFNNIIKSQMPIEEKISTLDLGSCVIAGLYSTALFILSKSLPGSYVISYRLPDDYYVSNQDAINKVYEFFEENTSIDIVSIKRGYIND